MTDEIDKRLKMTIICTCGFTMNPTNIEFQDKYEVGITAIFDCEVCDNKVRGIRWF